MIVARVIQGGGGAIFPLAFSIIRDEFPRERVAGAIGMISALIGVGAGVAIVLAGPIVDHLSYPLAVLDPGRHGRDRDGRDHVAGSPSRRSRRPAGSASLAALTLSGWLVCLLLGVSEGGNWGWTSPRVLGLFAAAVVLFVAWVAVELRATQPLVDVRHDAHPDRVVDEHRRRCCSASACTRVMVVVPAFLQTPRARATASARRSPSRASRCCRCRSRCSSPASLTGAFDDALRLEGAARGRVGAERGRHAVPGRRARQRVELLRRRWALVGLGIGFAFSAMSNLVVEAVPRHADRRRDRHERQRAHDRRLDRQPDRLERSIVAGRRRRRAAARARLRASRSSCSASRSALAGVAAALVPGRAPRAARPATGRPRVRRAGGRRRGRAGRGRPRDRGARRLTCRAATPTRNRERVLQAAVRDARPTTARRSACRTSRAAAGVGVGTVYRHFADRDRS